MGADGRFAPSPTGALHLGNLRTALLAWLFARSRSLALPRAHGGPRHRAGPAPASRPGSSPTCAALGLDWDGPVVRQSERGARYDAALARLEADGRLYPCCCTRRGDPRGRLGAARRRCRRAPTRAPAAASRRPSGPSARPPGARRRCASRADGARRRASRTGSLGTSRASSTTSWSGATTAPSAYNLAVVVDDAEQGIGEVVRGADLLDTTPRQLLARRAPRASRRPPTPTSRSCSGPTARAWPSATAP